MAFDPDKRPFASSMRWGLMALAALVLVVVIVWAIVAAT